MAVNIGIDLGMSNCRIAVKGRAHFVSGYPDASEYYLERCDVTIIPTPDGNRLIPSVLWADPTDFHRILIGTKAKQKAEEGDASIMFAKRSIGTDKSLKIHNQEFSARQVAAHTLRYLNRTFWARKRKNSRIPRGKREFSANSKFELLSSSSLGVQFDT